MSKKTPTFKLWLWEIFAFGFQAQRQHFSPEDGDMKLKCTASIGDIYWQVNEKSAEGFKSKRDSNTVYNTFVSEEDGPQGKKHTVEKFPKKVSYFFLFSLRFSPWIGIGLEFRSSMYPTAQFLSPCRIPKCRFKCQELAESTELKSTIGFSSPYKTKQNNSISAIWSSKPSVATISNRLAS